MAITLQHMGVVAFEDGDWKRDNNIHMWVFFVVFVNLIMVIPWKLRIFTFGVTATIVWLFCYNYAWITCMFPRSCLVNLLSLEGGYAVFNKRMAFAQEGETGTHEFAKGTEKQSYMQKMNECKWRYGAYKLAHNTLRVDCGGGFSWPSSKCSGLAPVTCLWTAIRSQRFDLQVFFVLWCFFASEPNPNFQCGSLALQLVLKGDNPFCAGFLGYISWQWLLPFLC